MAGGTGGHVFPALAVAEYLKKKQWDVFWLGGTKGLERQVLNLEVSRTLFIRFAGVRRNGVLGWLKLPLNLVLAIFNVVKFLIKNKPNVVIGFGGYVTVPGGIAAKLCRCPLVIHEQNATPGLSNRLLAKLSKKILLGFPNTMPKGIYVGNPLRSAFSSIPPPELRYRERNGRLKILIVGGSLGAKVFNDILPIAISRIPENERPCVMHQSGRNKLTELRNSYDRLGVSATLLEFIEDMSSAYAQADLVISRGGALSVSEIASVGVASFLIPYPFAVDDHQMRNSEFLANLGGAIVIPESELNPDFLAKALLNLDRASLLEMGVKAKLADMFGATTLVGQQIEDLMR